MNKIAGSVILYHPDKNVLTNINSYLDQVDRLYVIDNSEDSTEFVKKEFITNNKVIYLHNGKNLGIATALNIALAKTYEDNYEFLLTMDQDSYFVSDFLEKMLLLFSEDDKVALVSARQQHSIGKNQLTKSDKIIDRLIAMTSGNIVRVKLVKSIGGYKEDLFIDYVDHELCLRLAASGYKIKVCNDCIVIHSLGNITEKNFLWRKIYPTNHSYIRHYYQTRNRFFVYKTYGKLFPNYVKVELKNFAKTILKVFLYEENKVEKIKHMFRGYKDFRKNVFGEYRNKIMALMMVLLAI